MSAYIAILAPVHMTMVRNVNIYAVLIRFIADESLVTCFGCSARWIGARGWMRGVNTRAGEFAEGEVCRVGDFYRM
jgi:hypothetical protein